MKILAFSDWRVQPLKMIEDIVVSHKPDVILYAGDDLHRFVTLGSHLLIRTPNHMLKVSYPEFQPLSSKEDELFTSTFRKLIKHIKLANNKFFTSLNIPFISVNGNDDNILRFGDDFYIQIHREYIRIGQEYLMITETRKEKVTIRKGNVRLFHYLADNPELAYDDDFKALATREVKGIVYTPFNLKLGKFVIRQDDEKISVFGCESEYGLGGDILNTPEEYADIYISHLPPLGKLDLSARFGVEHIGSQKLLDAIMKNHPKIVICGHSHMWGGHCQNIGETIVVNVSSHDSYAHRWHGNYAIIDTADWSIEMKTNEYKRLRPIRGTLSGSKMAKARHESLDWRKPSIIKRITFNPEKHMFVDVETGLIGKLKPEKLWLIGVWFRGNLRQFLYPEEENEFINYLKLNGIVSLVSWTKYDHNVLRSVLARKIINIKFLDACQRAANCVIWHDYSLHGLYNALFPCNKYKDDLIPGHIAGLYADHLIFSNKDCPLCPPKERIMKDIKEKNRIDLLKMIEICKILWIKFGEEENKALIKDLTPETANNAVKNFRIAMFKIYKNETRVENMVDNFERSLQRRIAK